MNASEINECDTLYLDRQTADADIIIKSYIIIKSLIIACNFLHY